MKQYKHLFFILAACFAIASCAVVREAATDAPGSLDQPPASVVAKVDRLFPAALEWYERIEAELLSRGRPLTEAEIAMARKVGVAEPERVRVFVLDPFPMPEDPAVRAEAERYGLGSTAEGGRAMGYAIMLKPEHANSSTVLIHELVHVSQHDRLGRQAFLRRYIIEMEMVGYLRSPLETEAREKQHDVTPG